MTVLEHLIHQQVTASVVATLSRATDKIAEEMAQEILKDPAFRQEMQALIRRVFAATVSHLGDDPATGPHDAH
jgi:hypothetical protein